MPDTITAPAAPAAPATPAVPASAPEPVKSSEGQPTGQPEAAKTGTEAKLPDGGTVKKEENPVDPAKPYKVKAYGKEVSMSLEELQKYAEKGLGADKKFNEAFRKNQQAEQFLRLLKENPRKVLSDPSIGIDVKKFAEDILLEHINREQMTPEQRELHETKEKMKQYEEEKKTLEKQQADQQMQAAVEHYNGVLEKDITSTLQTSGLPKTAQTVARMAYYMSEGLKRGVEFKAADVVDLVRNDYVQMMNTFFSASDGDALIKLLGDMNVKKINETLIKKMNPPQPAQMGPVTPFVPVPPKEKMSRDEWREHMNRQFPG